MQDWPDMPRRRMLELSGSVLAGVFLAGCMGSEGERDERGTAIGTRTPVDADTPTTARTGTATETETGIKTETESTRTTEEQSVDPAEVSMRKLGQIRLPARAPYGGYSEAAVRPDGRYAVVGTKWGTSGTTLVDLANPAAPKRVHHLPSSNGSPNMDVKVHYRNGLYYRTIERDDDPSTFEIVDYGYRTGTPRNPRVMSVVEGPDTHNLAPHPTAPVLYTVNYYPDETESNGFDVYDVRDPADPRKLEEYGPEGYGHDITIDPQRELLYCAYQGGAYVGYVFFDVSDPRRPEEVGRFDYRDRPNYYEVAIGQPGYDSAHHSDYDPRRELLFLGDERTFNEPGGKHVLDVGWRDGSLSNPIPVGYTLSPNAKFMQEDPDGDGEEEFTQRLDWTGHHFDVIPYAEATLLVSADWHEGVVLYNVTDPTDPHPIDRYATTDGARGLPFNERVAEYGSPPMAWSAVYNSERDLVVVNDVFTGLYTFELDPPVEGDGT